MTRHRGHERIDVHQHLFPPAWVHALDRTDLPAYMQALAHVPPWSEDAALSAMDAVGTQTAILSVTSPGVHLGEDAAARRLAREVNEFGAELVRRRPDRFGLFASVPLPDVEGAVTEAVYALDELDADGVVLMSNADGQYLGDPLLRPLWQTLDERDGVVFVHPVPIPGLTSLPGTDGWADWPFDTTRTAVHMVVNGVLQDFSSVQVILAHAGGFLPYQSGRFEALAGVTPGPTSEAVHDDLRRFYFDTALSSTPATLAGLLEFAGGDHVAFGTDWPAAPLEPLGNQFAASLDAFLDSHPQWADQINHGTAQALFPRLGPMLA